MEPITRFGGVDWPPGWHRSDNVLTGDYPNAVIDVPRTQQLHDISRLCSANMLDESWSMVFAFTGVPMHASYTTTARYESPDEAALAAAEGLEPASTTAVVYTPYEVTRIDTTPDGMVAWLFAGSVAVVVGPVARQGILHRVLQQRLDIALRHAEAILEIGHAKMVEWYLNEQGLREEGRRTDGAAALRDARALIRRWGNARGTQQLG